MRLSFGKLEVPVWRLSQPARFAPASQLTDAGRLVADSTATDRVAIMVVVDPTGHVVRGTPRLETSSAAIQRPAAELQDRVLRMLPEARFDPALIGACRVNEFVMQSFVWSDAKTSAP